MPSERGMIHSGPRSFCLTRSNVTGLHAGVADGGKKDRKKKDAVDCEVVGAGGFSGRSETDFA